MSRRSPKWVIRWLGLILAGGVVVALALGFIVGKTHILAATTKVSEFVATVAIIDTEASAPAGLLAPTRQDRATGPLRVSPANPRYFTDGSGKAIFLTGSHTWDNRQDLGANVFDYSRYLALLEQYNHNFIRLWVWEQPKGLTTWPDPAEPLATLNPELFARTGPGTAADGGLKFDVTRYNQVHFDRLRQRIIEAGERGIYVSVMLFDGWSIEQKSGGANPWTYHPFNKDNNINGIDGDPNNDQSGAETHSLQIAAVTQAQEAYVRKVIDTVNDLDNVLYEISNESHPNSQEWQYHMINVIKDYEAGKPKQHPVGMTVEFPDGNNDELFASPADWISPNDYADPPPADGSKVIISDTDHIWGIGGDRDWAWRSFTRGLNVIYMDPWDGEFIPESPNEDLRVNMGYILSYANRMNLGAMTPRPDLCSTGYCLANPAASGAEYLVYLPSGSTATAIMDRLGVDKEPSIYLPLDSRVTVDLSATPGQLSVEWFDPSTGETISGDTAMGGDSRSFSAPSVGDAVLYLHQARPPTVFNIAARRLDTIAWFTWNTDEAATSQVEYGISPTLEISTTETNRYVTSHAVLITGLLPSTDYVYSVRSKDVAGNPTTSEIFGFTTVASEDIKLPRLPVILRVLQAE